MADLKAGMVVGTFFTDAGRQYTVKAVNFGTNPQLYVGQILPNGGIVIRSLNFVLANATWFVQASGIDDTMLTAALQPSQGPDTFGLEAPAGFTLPNGYAQKYDTDGTPYIINTDNLATDGSGTSDVVVSTTSRSGNIVDQGLDFVKKNPYMAIAIALVIGYIIHSYSQQGKKRKTKFLGLIA